MSDNQSTTDEPKNGRVVDDIMLHEVCRIGQKGATCRFLTMEPGLGMACAKHTSLRAHIDARVAAGNTITIGVDDQPERKP